MALTWFDRELPVLEATIALFEATGNTGPVSVKDIAMRSGVSVPDTAAALMAMRGNYVGLQMVGGGDPGNYFVDDVSVDARREVGQWPSVDAVAARLFDALSLAGDQESDPVRKSKLRAVAEAIGPLGVEVFSQVVGTALTKSIGI